jgi:uncharacterized membrane protein
MVSKRNQRGKKRLQRTVPPANYFPADIPRPPGAIIQSHSKIEAYSGPIPPPEYLERYNSVVPNAGEQIFRLWELQTRHRIELERRVTIHYLRRSWGGLTAGFIIGMTVSLGGIFAIVNGHDWAGTTCVCTGAVGLAGVFVIGQYMNKSERIQKARQMRK